MSASLRATQASSNDRATNVVSYEKKEGGYNKVLIFLLDNGERIVARLPTRLSGPSRLTTNSEVATITYVKRYTSVPVPTILDWSDDSANPVGSEYIIMPHVDGVQLQQRWQTMSGSQYTKCVQSVCMTMKQLAALEFPAYGSIYFTNAPLDSASKQDLVEGFCIGPYCGTSYCDSNDSQDANNISAPGPWSDLAAYASGLIDLGYSRLPLPGAKQPPRPSYFGTVGEHQSLLRSAQGVIQNLILKSQIRDAAAPTLLHQDLHARNIYVSDNDPTLVTCLIDWQSSSVQPAFIYGHDVPDFATPPTPPPLQGKEEASSRETKMSEEDKKFEKVAVFCSQAYDICTKAFIPKMRGARSVDQLLVRPFQYIHTSWRDSAPAVRQEFIDLANNWGKLGLAGSCPYNPTTEELKLHGKEYKSFERTQELKQMLIGLLNTDSDGWVPIDRWEEVRLAHKSIFDLALETARESTDETDDDHMSEEDVRELWPFDDQKCK